jgi:hypothetical protein
LPFHAQGQRLRADGKMMRLLGGQRPAPVAQAFFLIWVMPQSAGFGPL